MNDLIILVVIHQEVIEKLKEVLGVAETYQLVINLDEYRLLQRIIEILGHI